ncbi:MAG: glucokinase [Planctomycetes bacterium]|nr:glucokinase [Planctomycetota bacterium]
MAEHILAGDIGATKTLFARYAVEPAGLRSVREVQVPSRDFAGLVAAITAFRSGEDAPVAAAAFGVPGPVLEGRVVTTNLLWEPIELGAVARAAGVAPERVRLMNDLESTAYGALFLPEDRFVVLNPGVSRPGHIAVIAAGTGLGQAYLFWDGVRHRPAATEGGHNGFAPRTDREIALLRFLRARYGHVSFERVLSGPGLGNLFEFLHAVERRPVAAPIRERLETEDPSAVIGESGVRGECPVCAEAVDWFVSLYGFQAANQALTVMALGGVYIGGGIVLKLLPRMTSGRFMASFTDKGRYRELLAGIPVRILLDPGTSLRGAAEAARELVTGP